MPSNDLPLEEFFRTITGFDEIAIAKLFGEDVAALRDKPFRFTRALVFVDKRRGGLKDGPAYTAAMDLTMGDLEDYFPEPVDELDPDEPETEQGKEPAPSS